MDGEPAERAVTNDLPPAEILLSKTLLQLPHQDRHTPEESPVGSANLMH